MSVIAGIVHFSDKPVSVDDLALAAARLAAPGVGEPEFWIGQSAGLMVRQRIVTPEDMAERQPWVGGGGKLVLVYDGRLDNREALAAALGFELKGDLVPDGRLLLAALECWGEAALPRLIGDFALALWDVASRNLLLARDHVGRRTLYFHHGAGFVAFASTYRALLALPGVPRKIDELGIADFLILNTAHPIETFYQGVRRVPMATAAVFNADGMRENRYWTPKTGDVLRLSSDEEYFEAARELLDQAVACRLRAKGPLAAQMSGGLDSSAVAATAARLLRHSKLITVTSVPPEGMELPPKKGWYNDERPYIRAIAAMYPNMETWLASSTKPHWIDVDPTRFFEAGGMPARNISNIGWFMPGHELLISAGINVLLNGEGGNAGWSWDGMTGFYTMFKNGNWLRLAREIYQAGKYRPYDMDWKNLLCKRVILPLEPVELKKLRRHLKNRGSELWSGYSAINPDFAREINLIERCRQSGHDLRMGGNVNGIDQRLYMLSHMEHGRDIFTAMRALTGIESRAPLLDIRLLEFCFSLPLELFLYNGFSRRLPRLALAGRLPPTVLDNNRIGSQNPEILSRLDAMREGMVKEIGLLAKVPLAARLIDLPRLESLVKLWPKDNQVTLALPRAINTGCFLRWAEEAGC